MDLCAIPATGLARLIRSRELSATELLNAVLARIDEVNPALNAIVTLAAEQASDRAAELEGSTATRDATLGELYAVRARMARVTPSRVTVGRASVRR